MDHMRPTHIKPDTLRFYNMLETATANDELGKSIYYYDIQGNFGEQGQLYRRVLSLRRCIEDKRLWN